MPSSFPTPVIGIRDQPVASGFSRLLGESVTSLEVLRGGRNSRVYKLWGPGIGPYVGKWYVTQAFDGRDRLSAEFSSLTFLWEQGVRNIPKPICADDTLRCAIYEYVEGQPVCTKRLGHSELDGAMEFLGRLHALRRHASAQRFPPASEACFSIQAIVAQLRRRLRRLPVGGDDRAGGGALERFIHQRFVPALHEIEGWCQTAGVRARVSSTAELLQEERTLNPSDFGLHNAIRRRDGSLVFVDFEYFGWDDPAKMIIDFVLHPAMSLTDDLRRYAVNQLLGRLGDDGRVAARLEVVYPLWGLKWCLIFLNEYIPQDRLRRVFALRTTCDEEVCAEQLEKAREMLEHIMSTYEDFPYLD